MSVHWKNILRRISKGVAIAVATLFFLMVAAWLLLQTQWAKDIVKKKVVHYLHQKLQTEIAIGEIRTDWFNHLKISHFFIKDQQQRILAEVNTLNIQYSLWDLVFHKKITFSTIVVDGAHVNIYRASMDSLYNFDFIPAAFAGRQQKSADTVYYSFKPGILQLTHCTFLLSDAYGGRQYAIRIGSVRADLKQVDLEKRVFKVKDLNIDSCAANMSDNYFSIQTTTGRLDANNILCDLSRMNATAGDIRLLDHSTTIRITNAGTSGMAVAPLHPGKPFTYWARSVTIERNVLAFDNGSRPERRLPGINYDHLSFTNVDLHADTVGYDGNAWFAIIKKMNADEQCGFQLKQFSASVRYADTLVSVNNFSLRTSVNFIQGDLSAHYSFAGAITKWPAATNVSASIKTDRFVPEELLYFSPSLATNRSFRPLLGKTFSFNTTVSGPINKLHVPMLYVQQGTAKLIASADVFNLPDLKKLYVQLSIHEFTGTKKTMLSLLPKGAIADSLLPYLPERFSLSGLYKGTVNDMYTDLTLNSNYGKVSLRGVLHNIFSRQSSTYNATLSANRLLLNKMLRNTDYGAATVQLTLNGRGYDPLTMHTAYNGKIDAAVYNQYDYHDVQFSGIIDAGKINVQIRSNDPNADFTTDTHYDWSRPDGPFATNTSIKKIDLQALGFTNNSLSLAGNIYADIPVWDTAKLQGNIIVSGARVSSGSSTYALDTIAISAQNRNDTEKIFIRSPLLDASISGQYSLQSIPAAVRTIANKYLYTTSVDTIYTRQTAAQLHGYVHVPDSLLNLVPGLKKLTPFEFGAQINTDSATLTFAALIDTLIYKDYEVDSTFFSGTNASHGLQKELIYTAFFSKLITPSFSLPLTITGGRINAGQFDGKLALYDDHGAERYLVPYHITNDPRSPFLHIKDSLVIDRESWHVNDSNLIYLSAKAFRGSNLRISRGDEAISLLADPTHANGLPVAVQLNQFQLKNIANVLRSDTSFVEGIANGYCKLNDLEAVNFVSDIDINGLRLKGVPTGDLSLKVTNEGSSALNIQALLKGENNASLTGNYNLDSRQVDLVLQSTDLRLANGAPFVENYISGLQGSLHGNLAIKGDITSPDIQGKLTLDSVQALYKPYATTIRIAHADFDFGENDINVGNLIFTDSAGNKGVLTGKLFATGAGLAYDLKLKAHNFRAIGYKSSTRQNIFGPANVDATLTIKGGLQHPVINGAVNMVGGSQFTYVYVPGDNKSARGKGLIQFFDPKRPDSVGIKPEKVASQQDFNIDYDVTVNITPQSTISLVFDDLTGEHLIINGTAALNYATNAAGQDALTGVYTAAGGEYQIAIGNILRKKFNIQKGSTVTWSGDPLKASLNVTAIHTVRTSAGDLVNDVQNQSGVDRQRFDFQVSLLLKGPMLKPNISFKIDMPESEQEAYNGVIYTRLKQINDIPGELNKQVMGLLVLNNFIADNPFSSLIAGSNSFNNQAFNTAGNFLAQQLTDFLGNFIKGVNIELSLEMNGNYTSGTYAQHETDLKIGLSKSLARNRLSVYVGSSFALENHNQNTNSVSGLAGDATAEYLLTDDGRFRIKVYRVNENNIAFQGQIVKTGLTFSVVLEFNTIGDLLRSFNPKAKHRR